MPTHRLTLGRKTAPGVRSGRVLWKNNRAANLGDVQSNPPPGGLLLVKKRPGDGYHHLVTIADLKKFIGLVPEWDELSEGLRAVVLAPGEDGGYGFYQYPAGLVELLAWPREMTRLTSAPFWEESRPVLERLGVQSTKPDGEGFRRVLWTPDQARAFQLVNIFLHELGHHHDRITSRKKQTCGRGEPYAEAYARKYESVLWERYTRAFSV